MEESNIATTSVIIKQTAKELNISVEKVELVYKSLISFLRKVCGYSNAVAIFLPHLGTLYLKLVTIYQKINDINKKKEKNGTITEKNKKLLHYLLKKKEVLYKYLDNYPRPVSKSYHIRKTKFKIKSCTGYKSLDEIEEFQNSRNSR